MCQHRWIPTLRLCQPYQSQLWICNLVQLKQKKQQTQFRRSLKTHIPWLKAAHLCQQKGLTGMELNIETIWCKYHTNSYMHTIVAKWDGLVFVCLSRHPVWCVLALIWFICQKTLKHVLGCSMRDHWKLIMRKRGLTFWVSGFQSVSDWKHINTVWRQRYTVRKTELLNNVQTVTLFLSQDPSN